MKCEPKQCPTLTCKYPVTLDGQCCSVCFSKYSSLYLSLVLIINLSGNTFV